MAVRRPAGEAHPPPGTTSNGWRVGDTSGWAIIIAEPEGEIDRLIAVVRVICPKRLQPTRAMAFLRLQVVGAAWASICVRGRSGRGRDRRAEQACGLEDGGVGPILAGGLDVGHHWLRTFLVFSSAKAMASGVCA